MRQNIYKLNLMHATLEEMLFKDTFVQMSQSRVQTLYQGLEVGTQAVSNSQAKEEVLNFEGISSGAQVWQWLQGPFRGVVLRVTAVGERDATPNSDSVGSGGTNLGLRKLRVESCI